MSGARRFGVPAPDYRKVALVFGLVLATIGAALLLVMRDADAPRVWPQLLLATLASLSLLAVVVGRRRVVLEGGTLRVAAGLNGTRVAVSALDLYHARIVRLDEHPEYKPGIKTFGSAMPGYQAGHFRQAGGRKVFALLTDRDRVLALPERDGRLLLLSLDNPQSLLDALQRAAGPGPRRIG